MRRSTFRSSIVALASAGVAVAASGVSRQAHAQVTGQPTPITTGFALDHFQPSERGSDWFANESLDLRGKVRPALGVVFDYADKPLSAYDANGNRLATLVSYQAFAHVGGSINLFDRLRLGLSLPVLMSTGGDTTYVNGARLVAPGTNNVGASVGDLRLSADVRLFGEYRQPVQVAIGAQLFLATGDRTQYTGDGSASLLGRAMVSGDISLFTYAAQVSLAYHGLNDSYVGNPRGNQFNFAAAAGLRLLDGNLTVGPEIWGSTVIENGGAFTKSATPVEGIIGAHYALGWFRIGLGGGPGFTRGIGSPNYRLLGTLEFFPPWEAEKPAEKKPEPKAEGPKDSDGDGIVDGEDACPTEAGIKTSDPKTNGCPDKDGDGIVDKVDACPDVKGVANDDPKKNGCPPDSDGDGIVDSEDACPKDPGIKTGDPKTNGCPDKDGDGIPDMVDACPDVKGVKSDKPEFNGCPADMDGDSIPNETDACPKDPGKPNADPKKNGCPAAVVVGTEIKILDQVKFKTGSDEILKESDEILQGVAKILQEHAEIELVKVEGHTDNKGQAAYNKQLSNRRAASVVKWLTTKGKINGKRLVSQGYGQERPIDTNDTDAGRTNNRRVEFHILTVKK
jgi:OOP family OmpA-OmpF porin